MEFNQAQRIGRWLAVTLAALLAVSISPLEGAVIVQLKVLEGEGAIYAAGSRAARGLTVLVTDETGQPVEGATVSFRLPEQGPTGAFQGGLKTQVASTGVDGKAAVWGMQWNQTPGPFEVKITAVKDQARAGIVCTEYLSDAAPAKSGGTGAFVASHHPLKWVILGAVVAGAAGAGLALGRSHSSSSSSPVAGTVPTVIGAPVITVGHP